MIRSYLAKQPFLRKAWRKARSQSYAVRLLRDYIYDWKNYTTWWHGIGDDTEQKQLQFGILKAYHGFEKGLSLGDCRPGFGQGKLWYLIHLIEEWEAKYGETGVAVDALDALRSYQAFNAENDVKIEWLDNWLAKRSGYKDDSPAGTKEMSRARVIECTQNATEDFFFSRHSMRQFSDERVENEQIRQAVRLAQKSPSVCNRQSTRAYSFGNAMDALQHQPGNRGFGDRASHAIVVTADLQAFSGFGERNQAWVDGGMFAMSILYALHSLGLGACPLAWTQSAIVDKRIHDQLGIPHNEVIIMMIAVGNLPEEYKVAASRRIELDDVLVERAAKG